MKARFPGRLANFASIERGELFAFVGGGNSKLAMKAHRADLPADFFVHFLSDDDGRSLVILKKAESTDSRPRYLILDGAEIAPANCRYFKVNVEDVKPGWLGLVGDKAFLACATPGANTIAVEVDSGNVVPPPDAAAWFHSWQIYLPGDTGPDVLFKIPA